MMVPEETTTGTLIRREILERGNDSTTEENSTKAITEEEMAIGKKENQQSVSSVMVRDTSPRIAPKMGKKRKNKSIKPESHHHLRMSFVITEPTSTSLLSYLLLRISCILIIDNLEHNVISDVE